MGEALAEARRAFDAGEIPVGAILLDSDGNTIAAAHNQREAEFDPTGHAEILALREAAARRRDRILTDCTLVVTLEPCVMCAGAIAAARIPTVWFGAWDEKAGAVGSVYDVLRDHRLPQAPVEVVPGIRADECAELLRGFFTGLRTGNDQEPAASS